MRDDCCYLVFKVLLNMCKDYSEGNKRKLLL